MSLRIHRKQCFRLLFRRRCADITRSKRSNCCARNERSVSKKRKISSMRISLTTATRMTRGGGGVNQDQGDIYFCWWPCLPRCTGCTGCSPECCKNDIPLLMSCTSGCLARGVRQVFRSRLKGRRPVLNCDVNSGCSAGCQRRHSGCFPRQSEFVTVSRLPLPHYQLT